MKKKFILSIIFIQICFNVFAQVEHDSIAIHFQTGYEIHKAEMDFTVSLDLGTPVFGFDSYEHNASKRNLDFFETGSNYLLNVPLNTDVHTGPAAGPGSDTYGFSVRITGTYPDYTIVIKKRPDDNSGTDCYLNGGVTTAGFNTLYVKSTNESNTIVTVNQGNIEFSNNPDGNSCNSTIAFDPDVAGISYEYDDEEEFKVLFHADTPSSEGGHTINEYHWQFDDGTPLNETKTDNTPFTHTFTSNIETLIELYVTASNGKMSPIRQLIINPNSRPDVTGGSVQASTTNPLEVICTEINIDEPDDDNIAEYQWDFGLGESNYISRSTNETFTFQYSTDGNYQIRVRVRDEHGLYSEWHNVGTVETKAAPEGNIDKPSNIEIIGEESGQNYAVTVPALITFTPTCTDPDGDTTIDSVSWDFDSNPDFEVTGADPVASQSYVYNKAGVFDVRMKVVDEDNFESEIETISIHVLPDPNIGFPTAGGLPYDSEKEPRVDGVLDGPDGFEDCTYAGMDDNPANDENFSNESGWRGSMMHTYSYGTTADASFQLLKSRNGDFLYVGAEVNSDTAPALDDYIFIGIRNSSADKRRFSELDPATDLILKVSTAAANDVTVYTPVGAGETLNWQANPDAADDLLAQGFLSETDSEGVTWGSEIRIPVASAGNWPGINEDFMFYINIAVIQTQNQQYIWPPEAPEVEIFPGEGDLDLKTTPLWWGNADRSGSLVVNGIEIRSKNDIGTVSDDPDEPYGSLNNIIKYNQDNTFVAKIINDTRKEYIDDSDNHVFEMLPVENLDVTFRLANWGIPPASSEYWKEIKSPGNPVNTGLAFGRQDPDNDNPVHPIGTVVDAEPEVVTLEVPWSAFTGSDYPDFTEDKHQCMLVELSFPENTAADVNETQMITTKSVYRNMNFHADNQDTDAFTMPAEIASFGYGAPPNGEPAHKILLRVFTREWELNPGEITEYKEVKKRLQQTSEKQPVMSLLRMAYVDDAPFTPGPDSDFESGDLTPEDGPPVVIDPPAPGNVFPNDIPRLIDLVPRAIRPDILDTPYIIEMEPILEEYPETKVYMIEYLVKGYIYTGKKAVIDGVSRDILKPIGSYGHVVRHIGKIDNWDFQIKDAELIDENTYLLIIPPESKVIVNDVVDAVEPPVPDLPILSFGGGIGGAFPFAGPASSNAAGWNAYLRFGLNYRNFCLRLVYDYNNLNSAVLMSAAANLGYGLELNNFLTLYAEAGGGYYFDESGYGNFGLCGGAELAVGLSSDISIDIGTDINYDFGTGNLYLNAAAGITKYFR